MSNAEMVRKITELQELKKLRDELEAEITAAEDAIKAVMGESETLTAGAFRVTWKPVTSSRLDTSAIKRELPEVAARYTKTTTTKRFTVA